MPNGSSEHLEADRRAELAALWSRSQHLVEAFIRTMVFHADDRDDILQETAKQAALRFDEYDAERPFANWAVGIARYKVLEHRRKSARDMRMLGDDALDHVADAITRVQSEAAPRIEAMEACMGKLTPKHRMLMELRYTQEIDVTAIAKRMGAKPNTISAALYKVRAALADCIEERLGLMKGGKRGD